MITVYSNPNLINEMKQSENIIFLLKAGNYSQSILCTCSEARL